jgi:hypothetical protein
MGELLSSDSPADLNVGYIVPLYNYNSSYKATKILH